MTNDLETQVRQQLAQLDADTVRQLLEEAAPHDTVEFDDRTGYVTIWDEDTRWRIRPPKLGTLRDLDLLAAKLTRQATASAEAAALATPPADVDQDVAQVIATPALHEQVLDTLPWWELLFERCADLPFPDTDDAPIWMGGVTMVSLMLTHWMTYPLRGRGISRVAALLSQATSVQR